jgi:hypothetical protein
MSNEEQKDECLYGKELKKNKNSDVRGSLKLEASTSKPITAAGEEISIYVVIRNPFSVPVKIFSTETHIPVDIMDQLAQKRYRKKINDSRQALLRNIKQDSSEEVQENIKQDSSEEVHKNIKQDSSRGARQWLIINALKFKFLVTDIFQFILSLEICKVFPLFSFLQFEPDERVAIAVTPDEEESSGSLRYLEKPSVKIDNLKGTVNATLGNKIDLKIENLRGNLNLTTGETNDIKKTDDLLSQTSLEIPEEFSITLYPGDSLVKHFVLKTRRWLFFNPVSHTFQIQVRYRIDERDHIDTIPFSVDIRAPMRSSIVGAIVGSILGLIVSKNRNFGDFQDILFKDLLLNMSRTIIFALIIIVAFARKSNVQQVVSVEDFWGGLFTGFLVGYSGDSFIQSILGESNGE